MPTNFNYQALVCTFKQIDNQKTHQIQHDETRLKSDTYCNKYGQVRTEHDRLNQAEWWNWHHQLPNQETFFDNSIVTKVDGEIWILDISVGNTRRH